MNTDKVEKIHNIIRKTIETIKAIPIKVKIICAIILILIIAIISISIIMKNEE